MLELDTRQIRMGQRAADKAEALRLLGAALVADGLAAPGYAEGLKAREAQGSTYLGQGIAIPHGTPDTREQVFSTGVRLLQFPEGVDWGDGQQVYLAIGIAAKSDEHLQLLQLLTRALGEADLGPALSAAASAEEVLGLLQGAPQELALDAQLVGLGQNAEDLDELAWLGARLLKKAGCVENGFAAVLQQTEPLPLGEAHQALLERLCDLLLEGRGAELVRATSSRSVLAALGGELPPDWPSARAVLANPHGLHARPAQALAQLAKGFAGEIRVRLADSEAAPVSAKSLSKLLALGARRGQTLEFSAEPAIAEDALPALLAAVREGLGEEVEALAEEALPDAVGEAEEDARPAPLRAGERLQAIAASPGIASGPAHVQVAQRFEFQPRGESPAHERERLLRAKRAVDEEIVGLVERSTVKAIREIFVTHREMLDDPELAEQVQLRLNRGESAEAAWSRVVEDSAAQQEALHDALLAERAADLRDLGRRVLARLCGVEAPREPEQPYILVMDEVGPSDVARLDAQRVAGILTARGGATSHSAIIARALGIPALVGAGAAVLGLEPGTALLLDGEHGWLQVAPSTEQLQQAAAERDARQQRQARADAQRLEPARTRDGHAVEVCANLGDTAGAARAVELGAEGVGLLRTEFVFMNNARAPDLATQEAEYRRVLDALDGRPLVARTLDVGGDKPLPYWPIPHEENPYLGLRGIRLTLQRPQILETQLRALFRAAGERPLRVMFPMVGSLDEWRQARDLALRLREEIPLADLQLGIMVEVPSAALLAPVLAREVDFFSVGTNDLTQYTLAIDRGHPSLSAQADGLHPAVLQLIDMTVRAAHAEGKWVGVCGELAADPLALPLLVGLGVDELSVSARSIALVKAGVRELQLVAARGLARKALGLASAAEVRALVEAEVQ
ncbi:TPA: phosphoenolpyruvate--protein phosphotransferase [Pseudomonas aeruginosa]|nr:phosphoenolpyruvate--protein phosphotransferase [Pseudomonas aeruginosa]HCW0492193.1 phosphoenolpyruvate--protein phosphotransferase [Pseudomonas aeruginosa]HCW0594496.1 phosphoenolpyruvate--protein phosphotransferase [Pseudomonas aeruginosa]